MLYTGVDPYQLGAEIGGPYRWANIACWFHGEDWLLMRQLITSNGLRPDVVIVVANPGMLAMNRKERGWYDPRLLFQHLAHRQFREVQEDVLEISHLPFRLAFPYRDQICVLIDRSLFKAKLRLFQAWGSGLDSLVAPDPDPWREPFRRQPPMTPETNSLILKGHEKLGWFDPARYRSDGQSFQVTAKLFRSLHANGTRTFLVLAPESSAFRSQAAPPDNAFHLTHTLPKLLGEAAPVVLDFRASAPDEDFRDVNHLNPEGRVRMTERLAKALKPYLIWR